MKSRKIFCLGVLCAALSLPAAARDAKPIADPAPAAGSAPPSIEGGLYHTAENIPVYGAVRAYSPGGGPVELIVVTPPERGMLRVDGTSFQYTPYPGQRGADSFTVVAAGPDGRRSEQAVIAVTVESAQGLPYFCDMDKNPYEYSAVQLAKAGIVCGEQIGSRRYYAPERQVTRGELIVQLLAARGWEQDLPACVNTGLEGDEEIPPWLKSYVRRAVERGLITEGTFDAATVPTRAEAVVLTARAAGIQGVLKAELILDDFALIPDWAMEAYVNLSAYRMLDFYDGRARPGDALRRDYAASLLWQLYRYAQGPGRETAQ